MAPKARMKLTLSPRFIKELRSTSLTNQIISEEWDIPRTTLSKVVNQRRYIQPGSRLHRQFVALAKHFLSLKSDPCFILIRDFGKSSGGFSVRVED